MEFDEINHALNEEWEQEVHNGKKKLVERTAGTEGAENKIEYCAKRDNGLTYVGTYTESTSETLKKEAQKKKRGK